MRTMPLVVRHTDLIPDVATLARSLGTARGAQVLWSAELGRGRGGGLGIAEQVAVGVGTPEDLGQEVRAVGAERENVYRHGVGAKIPEGPSEAGIKKTERSAKDALDEFEAWLDTLPTVERRRTP